MRRNRHWRKVLWVVLILSVVMLALLLAVQFTKIIRDSETEQPEEFTEPFSQEESQPEESQTAATEEPSSEDETESEAVIEDNPGYIIIGDSHTVVAEGMGYSVYGSRVEGVSLNRNLFIVNTGLDPVMGTITWLESSGAERMREIITEHTEFTQWNIISLHGTSMVTQPDIAARYIRNYQNWMEESFRDCQVYIVSVPPLDEAEWVVRHPDMPKRSNQDIVVLNQRIQEAFPENYFDYYDWFLEHSDSFLDEIHYTGKTYCELFDEILEKISQ